ncbi:MAG: FkbM family methyltransferase [Pseudomonadota bacterium]
MKDLVRLGSEADGGYIVTKKSVDASTLVISMGLNDDWSFEEEFTTKANAKAKVLCFDHTVTPKFWVRHALRSIRMGKLGSVGKYFSYKSFFSQPGIQHRKMMIGYDGPGATSLATLMKEIDDQNIFLKIDIEGWEYRIFEDVIASQDRVTAIAMELHDIDLHRDRITDFLSRLKNFTLIHLHGNNYGGVDAGGDPLVIELTLVRNDLVEPATDGPASSIAVLPNNPALPEIDLVYG